MHRERQSSQGGWRQDIRFHLERWHPGIPVWLRAVFEDEGWR